MRYSSNAMPHDDPAMQCRRQMKQFFPLISVSDSLSGNPPWIAGAGLGAAGLILILLSIFNETDTLKWGMLCAAPGSILVFVRMLKKKTAEND